MKQNWPAKFGDNVKRIRLKKGLTQQALAEKADLSVNFIGFVENAKRNITMRNIARVADGLECSVGELFRGITKHG